MITQLTPLIKFKKLLQIFKINKVRILKYTLVMTVYVKISSYIVVSRLKNSHPLLFLRRTFLLATQTE